MKSIAKSKTETRLRINEKNFQNEQLQRELFITTRQENKIRNDLLTICKQI